MRAATFGAIAVIASFLFGPQALAGPHAEMMDRLKAGASNNLTPEQRVAEAKMVVLHYQRDADSARFRNVRLVTTGLGTVICGEVNARNGFGGYTGFQEFVTAGEAYFAFGGNAIEDLGAYQATSWYCGYVFRPEGKTIVPVSF